MTLHALRHLYNRGIETQIVPLLDINCAVFGLPVNNLTDLGRYRASVFFDYGKGFGEIIVSESLYELLAYLRIYPDIQAFTLRWW